MAGPMPTTMTGRFRRPVVLPKNRLERLDEQFAGLYRKAHLTAEQTGGR